MYNKKLEWKFKKTDDDYLSDWFDTTGQYMIDRVPYRRGKWCLSWNKCKSAIFDSLDEAQEYAEELHNKLLPIKKI